MASKYWVGGAGTWNSASSANWATTSGGAGGTGAPTSSDDVFFDANSGSGTVVWGASGSASVVSITCTGYTGTLAISGINKNLTGTGTVWTSPVGCTITGAATMTVTSTGTTPITVTCNHASPSTTNAPNFNFSGGTYPLTLNGTGFGSLTFIGSSSLPAGTIGMYGSALLLSGGGTYTSLNPTFLAASTITSNGRTIGSTTVNAPGATVTTAGALTLNTTSTFTLTAGTLSIGGTLSTGIFSSSNSSTRVIAFGANNIALTSTVAATTVLSMATATGFTWTGTGGFTRNQAATATLSLASSAGGSSAVGPNLTVNAGASALTITSTSYFKNLIFTGSTCTVTGAVDVGGNLTLATGGTYTGITLISFGQTSNLAITTNGKTLTSVTFTTGIYTATLADALTVSGATTLNAGTLDLGGFTLTTGTFASGGNTNTYAIAFGSANIALTSTVVAATVLNLANTTNFSWTGTGGFTRNQAATATVTCGTTSGSVAKAVNLTVNAGASALTVSSGSYFKNLDFTGSISTVTASGLNMAGNLTLATGGTYTAVAPTFLASGTLTSVGKTLSSTTVNGSGITTTLGDDLRLTNALTLTQGTFTAANFNASIGSFSSNNSNTRTLNMGSGTWTIAGSGATAWDTATTTGLTLNPSTSTITMTSASAKTFAGGGLTYYILNQGGAGALTVSGSNTFTTISNSVQPTTFTFTSGTTQTVTNFNVSGTVGNLVTIGASTTSAATLSKASGTVNSSYLSLSYSTATGGAVWNALNSTNGGNNTGWNFIGGSGNMFLMFN